MYKLMIVDDEAAIRSGLKNIIDWDDLGIEVVGEAENGKEALTLINHFEPHIVLTDIRMPHMDGIEFLQELTKHHSHIKVAVLSGFNDFSYVHSAMRLGAVNYLLKPVDIDELKVAMKEILETIDREKKNSLEKREFYTLLQKKYFKQIDF